MPKVTVLMAVHNGEPYLQQAVQSILGQSFQDFEFLIVDDASTDNSGKLLSGLSNAKVRIIANGKQLGLSSSLNQGIEASEGTYIARMDHDDISLPERLWKQTAFLDAHPEVDVIGSWAQTLGLQPAQIWRYPTLDEDIRSEFIFNSSLVHGSVMLRKATFDRHQLRYDATIARAQDYELWTRAAPQIRFANLDAVLVQYRIHPEQAGSKYGTEQRAVAEKVRQREIARLGVEATSAELALHNRVSRWEMPTSRAELQHWERWFLKLRAVNQETKAFPWHAFDRALERRWWETCRANTKWGLEAWHAYAGSLIAKKGERSALDKALFWAKASLWDLGWRRA